MREDPSTPQSPAVLPGQVWVIEHDSDAALSSVNRDALTSANVVLYDRALAPLLAEILPLGGYAEPLSFTGATCARRALDLAAQGWSVVQLVTANSGQPARCHAVAPLRTVPTVARSGLASAFTANGLAG
jgi:hypothetical protein